MKLSYAHIYINMGNCFNNYTKEEKTKCVSLSNATLDNIPEFSLSNTNCLVKVLDVYDGDTITIAFPFNGSLYKKRCRINGVDCAEIRTKDKEEKKCGLLAKEYLKGLIMGKILYAEFRGNDKYGRLLANIYIENKQDLAAHMISQGFGRAYNGGKKTRGKLD